MESFAFPDKIRMNKSCHSFYLHNPIILWEAAISTTLLLLIAAKSPFCFPTILLRRSIDSKRNPIMLKHKDPLFLPRIDPADWKLPGDN